MNGTLQLTRSEGERGAKNDFRASGFVNEVEVMPLVETENPGGRLLVQECNLSTNDHLLSFLRFY